MNQANVSIHQKQMQQLRHCIATVSLSGTLKEKLQAIAAAGFDAVEIFENDLISFDGNAKAVREMASDLGLEILLFQPFRDFEGMPEPQRSRAFDRAERKFDLMQELDTDLLLICSSLSPDALPGLERAAEDLHELGERAKARDLRVGFEALAWGKHINDYRDAWEVVRRANHPNIGTIIDSFHVFSRGHELNSISNIPAEKIFYIHLADAPTLDMGALPWSRHFRCFPGQGRFPLVEFMQALQTTRYTGPISLEIFNDQFRAASAHQVALDAKRSLLYLQEQLELSQSQANPENLVAATQQKTHADPAALYEGIEFMEFAVTETEVSEFESFLSNLGFQHWGKHKSKQVSVWRQGDIKLVINSEADGFAYNYNAMHGTSVAAVAFRVSDISQALKRAEYYHCKVFQQEHLPNEAVLPAIQTLDGSLIYFVTKDQDIWSKDFDLRTIQAVDSTTTTLNRLDHFAQVTAFGRQSSWLLFYRSVFGFDAADELDLLDPSGLIRSQVVESKDKHIRIVLNGSQSQTTITGRFLSEFIGGGVQHIAFETEDLVSLLEQNQLDILPIPENYYDDLEARFGLEPTFLAQLKKHNILYDQTKDGFFLQAYTKSFANRFFFELIQRENYDQFAVQNAPIRIAAQQRLANLQF